MNVVVNGLMVNYQKVGKGRPLIMLHGWGDSQKTFLPLADELKDKWQIYTLDLPGFGGSQAPPEAWGLNDYAGFVNSWLNKLDIKESYCLLGHSFGGAVAIVGTADKRLNPEKLILLASAGVRDKKPFQKKALQAVAKTGRIPLYFLPASKAQQIKLKFYGRIGSDLLLVPTLRETFKKTVSQDVRALAMRISQPTMLIYGSADRETPASDGRLLHELIKGSKLEVIEASHMLHQTNTAEVSGLIKNFLEAR